MDDRTINLPSGPLRLKNRVFPYSFSRELCSLLKHGKYEKPNPITSQLNFQANFIKKYVQKWRELWLHSNSSSFTVLIPTKSYKKKFVDEIIFNTSMFFWENFFSYLKTFESLKKIRSLFFEKLVGLWTGQVIIRDVLLSKNFFEIWKSFSKQLFHKFLFAFWFEQNVGLFFLVCGFGAFTAAKGGFDYPFTLRRHKLACFPLPTMSVLRNPIKCFFVEVLK